MQLPPAAVVENCKEGTKRKLKSRSCIVDGEAVACDDDGVASFDLLRHRRRDDRGDDLRHYPIERRKADLTRLLAPTRPGLRLNEWLDDVDGPTIFEPASSALRASSRSARAHAT